MTETTSATRAFRTWSDRLDTGRLTKAQIQQFARVVIPLAEQGAPAGGKRSNLTAPEACILRDRIAAQPVLLTSEHTEQGLTWLDRRGVKELGDPTVRDLVSLFSHFSWDGDVEWHSNGYRSDTVPIWTVHLTDGRRFKYWFASGWREAKGSAGELWQVRREA